MTAPDLELAAGLSAGELRTHVAPDAHVRTTGRCVAVERSETRIGISEKTEAGGCYRNVVVEMRLIAWNQVPGLMPDGSLTCAGPFAQDPDRFIA
jgi:hypothetical protein